MFTILRIDAHASADPMPTERAALAASGRTDVVLRQADAETPEQLIAAAREADVLLTDCAMLTGEVLRQLPRCRAVIRYGVGYDTVDAAAAAECGIAVINVPDFCAEEVSNHVMMFLLAAAKKLRPLDALVRQGQWRQAKALQAPMGSIHGETLGIIGCGNLGQSVAVKAHAFGMRVIGHSPHTPPALMDAAGIRAVSLEELLRTADYISLNTSLTARTHHLIDRAALAQMKPNAVLINCARGAVVDEAALIEALRARTIAGACLDVFETEPLPGTSPLCTLDNVLLMPHDASYSDASFRLLKTRVIEEALRVCDGIPPLHIVNTPVRAQNECSL